MPDLDLTGLNLDLGGLDLGSPGAPSRSGLTASPVQAARHGTGDIFRTLGDTADVAGMRGLGDWLRQNAPQGAPGYSSGGSDFIQGSGSGELTDFNWSAAPDATMEQVPQAALSIGARGAGAAAGLAVGGPLGAAAGAFAGPALAEFAQRLGPIVKERVRRRTGDENAAPTAEDWGWAIGGAALAGSLEGLGIGRLLHGSGLLRTAVREGVTEAGESVVEQGAGSVATPTGIEIDPKQAIGEGLIGGMAGGSVNRVAGAAATRAHDLAQGGMDTRVESGDDAALAQRIRDRGLDLDIREPGQAGGAEEAVKSTATAINTEASRLIRELQAGATGRGDHDASDALAILRRTAFGAQTNSPSPGEVSDVAGMFAGDPRAEQLMSLARQRTKLNQFLRPQGTLGGISKYTRFMDPFEDRATGFQRAFGMAALLGPTGIPGLVANRAAKYVDRATGNYSPVQKFVEQAGKSGIAPTDVATRADDHRRSLQADAAARKVAEEAQAASSREASQQRAYEVQDALAMDRQRTQSQNFERARQVGDARAIDSFRERGMSNQERQADRVSLMAYRAAQKAQEQEQSANSQSSSPSRRPSRPARSPEAPPSGTSTGGTPASQPRPQQAASSPAENNDRYFGGRADERLQWVDHFRRQLRGERSEPPPGTLNSGAHKAARGEAVASERAALMSTLASAGWTPQQASAVTSQLADMDHKESGRTARKAGRDRLHELLEDNTSPEAGAVLRMADMLVEAAPDDAKAKAQKAAEAVPDVTGDVRALVKALAKVAPKASNDDTLKVALKDAEGAPTAPADPVEVQAIPEPTAAESREVSKDQPARVKKALERARAGRSRGKTLENRLGDREAVVLLAQERAGEYPGLRAQIDQLTNSRAPAERIKGLILKGGTGHVTFGSLVDEYASLYNSHDPAASARDVAEGLQNLKQQGIVSSVKVTPLRRDGRAVEDKNTAAVDKDGNPVKKYLDEGVVLLSRKHPFSQSLDLAKSWALHKGSVDITQPKPPAGPEVTRKDGDVGDPKVSMTNTDEFVNAMRGMGTGVNRKLLGLLQESVKTPTRALQDSLIDPVTKGTDNLNALAQLGVQTRGHDGPIFQEFFSGANGRTYSKNRAAHSQGGDLMKALIRANVSKPPGDGLPDLFQSWGNVFGSSKVSPADRRQFVVDNIGTILSIASAPYSDRLGSAAKDLLSAEGPHQATAAALDLKHMVDFAMARPAGKKYARKKDYKALLSDPEALADVAQNWSTDALVQFDANNNAYQITGLLLGDQDLLEATGMAARAEDMGVDPDRRSVADIYMAPAKTAVENSLPELAGALSTPMGLKGLRAVFKKPVGIILYTSSPQTEARAVFNGLTENPGVVDMARLREGLVKKPNGEFEVGGSRFKLEKDGAGYRARRYNPRNRTWTKGALFGSVGDAQDATLLADLSSRAASAVRGVLLGTADTPGMYPRLRESMAFFQALGAHLKATQGHAYFPTPDGDVLRYDFKDVPEYRTQAVSWTNSMGKPVSFNLAYTSGLSDKKAGRGMAAFFAHTHDAYVMRQGFKDSGATSYNPIHDSHGFHPSEARRGRNAVVEAMLSLKDTLYKTPNGTFDNAMEAIMALNGLDPAKPETWPPALQKVGIPKKGQTKPEEAKNLLTAVS